MSQATGGTHAAPLFDRAQAAAYLDILFGDRPARVVLAHQIPGGKFSDTETFDISVPDQRTALLNRAEFLTNNRKADVWITPNSLNPEGRRQQADMDFGHAVWVDLDAKDAHSGDHLAWAVEEIRNRGGLIVHSSDDGVHGYFMLDAPLAPDDVRRVNRSLQRQFKEAGADTAAVDASRLLRLPGTFNRKYDPPQAVTIELGNGLVEQGTADLLRNAPYDEEPAVPAEPEVVYTDEVDDGLEALLNDWDVEHGQISEAFHRRVKECKERGLTPGKATTLLSVWLSRVDPGHRYLATPSRLADQVARSWNKPDTRNEEIVADPNATEEEKLDAFEREVQKELLRLDAREEATRRRNAAKMADRPKVAELALDWDTLMDQQLPEFQVEDILIEGGIGLLAGESGLGKSFVAIDLLLSVAAGVPFLGKWATKQTKTLYVVGEGAYRTRLDALAWAREHKLDRVDGFVVYPAPVNLNNETDVDRMVEFSNENGFGLVCIDTLSQSTAGGNENDNGEMAAAMHAAHRIAATTLLVHHTGKNPELGMRGASVLHNNADTVIHQRRIKKTVDGKEAMLGQQYSELYLAKSKASADHYVLGTYERAVVELGVDPRKPANVLTTCVMRPYVVVTDVTIGATKAEEIAQQMYELGFTCQNKGKEAIKKRWNELLEKNGLPTCTASDVTVQKAFKRSMELWLDGSAE